jgi:hypothetical protein
MGMEEEQPHMSPLAATESGTRQEVVMETTATTTSQSQPVTIPIPHVVPSTQYPMHLIHIIPQDMRQEPVRNAVSPNEAQVFLTSDLTVLHSVDDSNTLQFGIIDQSSPLSVQTSDSSKEFTFRLQIANDEDVKLKSPTGLHLQDSDKFQLEQLMTHAVKRANYSDSSDDLPSISEEKLIQDFMAKHVTSELHMKSDISVKDLRRIIPIMIMQLFNIREERTQKKVKGLWTERPKGWPEHIPYYDPNNQTKDGPGKPKKETLKKMFEFLLVKYREYIGGNWPMEQAMVTSVEDLSCTGTTPTSTFTASPSSCHIPMTLITKKEKHVDCDDEWVQDLMARIHRKVAVLEKDLYMAEKTVGLLCIIRDLLEKMFEVRHSEEEIGMFFVTSGHEFEAALDIVRLKQEMSKEQQQKWEEFQDKWYVKIVSLANQAQGGSETEIIQAEPLTSVMGQ